MNKQFIYLVGFMACGKTHYGKKLATALGCKRIDLDHYIEEKTQLPIKNIFSFWGEKKFREIETACLKELHASELTVVSCGGGTPCFNNNLEFMNQMGLTVFLNVASGHLVQRLITTPKKRPMIEGKTEDEIKSFVEKLLEERMPYYIQSDIHFNPIEEKMEQLIQKIQVKLL